MDSTFKHLGLKPPPPSLWSFLLLVYQMQVPVLAIHCPCSQLLGVWSASQTNKHVQKHKLVLLWGLSGYCGNVEPSGGGMGRQKAPVRNGSETEPLSTSDSPRGRWGMERMRSTLVKAWNNQRETGVLTELQKLSTAGGCGLKEARRGMRKM